MLKDEIQMKMCIDEINDILTSMLLFKCKNNNPFEVIVLKSKIHKNITSVYMSSLATSCFTSMDF